ncbi:sensor histidine kinase [Chitinivorax sp. B]|uniref:sensor histidine kinase n=1 Tax=Chitinivorax sp. B TaxID=2502235 RepID=UPI0010F4945B|nr:sensor histidine kinase [Chitinivorax sp. B]
MAKAEAVKPAQGLSLRRQLLLWLLVPQIVLWSAAIYVAYTVALRYANIAIDQGLFQSTRALARQVKPLGDGLYIDFPRAAQQILEEEPDDRVYYMVSTPPGKFVLGNDKLPQPTHLKDPQYNHPYFYDGVLNGHKIRLAALFLSIGTPEAPQILLVQVAKGVALRERMAHDILVDTVLPLSVLMLLTSLLVWGGVSHGLSPLRRLRRLVENRTVLDLAPIEITSAPAEVRSLASALNTLMAAVTHNISYQRRFIADAAHQLRTPMAGLKSQTELALNETDPQALKQRLQHVHTSASRTVHMVNQLLTLARAEPDQQNAMPREPLDLARLVRDLAADIAPRVLNRGLELECYADVPSQIISGNSTLLREMLTNLIDNAIRYAGKGCTITLRVLAGADSTTLEVEDNGPGIPDSDKEKVFDRFYRVSQQSEGCGLGLAIVREIANRHAADVTLRDAQPHGLLVSIRFQLDHR